MIEEVEHDGDDDDDDDIYKYTLNLWTVCVILFTLFKNISW